MIQMTLTETWVKLDPTPAIVQAWRGVVWVGTTEPGPTDPGFVLADNIPLYIPPTATEVWVRGSGVLRAA